MNLKNVTAWRPNGTRMRRLRALMNSACACPAAADNLCELAELASADSVVSERSAQSAQAHARPFHKAERANLNPNTHELTVLH